MINPTYLTKKTLNEMHASFVQSNPHTLLLSDFLEPLTYRQLAKELNSAQGKHAKIPDEYSYSVLDLNPSLNSLIASQSFLEILQGITHSNARELSISIRTFSHKDYTLLHDRQKTENHVQFFFTLSDNFPGNAGGQIIFTHPKHSSLIMPPQGNTFFVIHSPHHTYFVKYLNHNAIGKSLIIVEGTL